MIYLLNTPWITLVDLIKNHSDYNLVYDVDEDQDGTLSFDMFNESKRCFVFMKSKQSDFEKIEKLCSYYEKSDYDHVIVWNPSSSLSSKLLESNQVECINKDMKISKKNLSSYIKSRTNKVKINVEPDALEVFSDIIGSSDFSYEIDLDMVELRYRSLLLKCVDKNDISSNDIYEVLGDDIVSADNSFFVLCSKGNLDLFFYILKEKIQNKTGYEKEEFIFRIINYFEHEVRLKIMISSMLENGMDSDSIINNISKMKKLKTGRLTYSKNQIKFFLSKISIGSHDSIKKENEFKLIAINSCRKTLRSGSNPAFKDTYIMFLIMYLMNMISFGNFYNVIYRLRI